MGMFALPWQGMFQVNSGPMFALPWQSSRHHHIIVIDDKNIRFDTTIISTANSSNAINMPSLPDGVFDVQWETSNDGFPYFLKATHRHNGRYFHVETTAGFFHDGQPCNQLVASTTLPTDR